MANKLDITKNVQRIAAKQSAPLQDDRPPTIAYPISTRATEPELPTLVGTLSDRLQEIARQYIGARRRSGEALLEAARWIGEARAEAQRGEWSIFLEATSTSDDTAERLLNIHRQAMQNPQFAEAVRTNWIGQSVAALLAQPSTPQEVVTELLGSPEPPTVAEVRKKVGQARYKPVPQKSTDLGKPENPQIADYPPASPAPIDVLREVARAMAHIERSAGELPADAEIEHQLEAIERSLSAIRQSLLRRGGA